MKDATLAQGYQVLNLILQKRLPAEQLQAIIESGLLSVLLDANIGKINREEFRRVCGFKPFMPTFSITCDDSRKTSELIKLGHYDWHNDWITDERFPIQQHPPVKHAIEFVEVDYDPTSEDILCEFKGRGLNRPTYEDALNFGIQHKDEQRNGSIVFLHEPVLGPSGGRDVLVLRGGAGVRYLDLDWFDYRWYRFPSFRRRPRVHACR